MGIQHARNCTCPKVILRRSWAGEPELFCIACGRSCQAKDTRETTEPIEHTR